MKWLSKCFHLINILNLDVAIGAVGMARLTNYILSQSSPNGQYYLLFSAVWSIYLVDHLYDSRKPEAVSERRKFFKMYYPFFLRVLIINLLITLAVFVVHFDVLMLVYASPAFGITGVYILANWLFQENKQRFYLKEILIAMGYSIGIMVIPLTVIDELNSQVWLIASVYILMALWNLLLIARFEKNIDQKEGQTSMNQWVSNKGITIINFIIYTLFIGISVTYALLYKMDGRILITWISIAIYMLVPLIFPRIFRKKEKYHRYVDMVFLLAFLHLIPLKF